MDLQQAEFHKNNQNQKKYANRSLNSISYSHFLAADLAALFLEDLAALFFDDLAALFFDDLAGVCLTADLTGVFLAANLTGVFLAADLTGVFLELLAICLVLVPLLADTLEALFLAADFTGVEATGAGVVAVEAATTGATGFEALLVGVDGFLLDCCFEADLLVADQKRQNMSVLVAWRVTLRLMLAFWPWGQQIEFRSLYKHNYTSTITSGINKSQNLQQGNVLF